MCRALAPDSPATGDNGRVQPAYVSLLALAVAILVLRAINRERREYGRFKRMRTTRARQKVYRRWLIESFVTFSGLSAALLFATWGYVPEVIADARGWPPIERLLGVLEGTTGVIAGAVAAVAFLAIAVLPPFLLRNHPDEVRTVGDIGALLPRTRAELRYGLALSLNAGVLEEVLFRLAFPALLFAIVGDGVLAFVAAAALFGMLHSYQGPVGVTVAVVLGLGFGLVYVLTGSILVVILAHIVLDLRTLVIIPWAVTGLRDDGEAKRPAPQDEA